VRGGKTHLVGVYPTKGGKWMARIRFDGAAKSLGNYDTAEEAHRVFVKAHIDHHGIKSEFYEPPVEHDERGAFRRIPLTRDKFALVDDADYPLVSRVRWAAMKSERKHFEDTFYAVRTPTVDGKKVVLLMHRLILNAPDDRHVDHADHEGLNNRRFNLRLSTVAQNTQNMRKADRGLPRGVVFVESREKYVASIRVGGRHKALGYFDSAEAAGAAYDAASLLHHGDFGIRNQ